MNFKTHTYSLTILEGHLDTFGHVNNAKYLEILEEARWDFITSHGFGLKKIQETGKGPVILEIKMKFLKELKLREKITIESQTQSLDRLVATLRQRILNEAGEIMFEAEMVFGFFDTQARKLIRPTDEWLKAIGAMN
jgi:thioesterase-3